MRDRATRVAPSAMPNNSPDRTSVRVGSRGGSTPSSVEATTDRAVRGLRDFNMCDQLCNTAPMVTTTPARSMVPDPRDLPDVLPTERLTASGKPVPALRAELRRIASVRNVSSVLLAWGQGAATIGLAVLLDHPVVWVAAFLAMGPVHARFAILAHEAAHRLLFVNRVANDLVGRWLLAYPALLPFEAYRRVHFAHHRDELGPEEPDLNLYSGYPITRRSFRRKLTRDATGISGWKNLRGLLRALRSRSS